MMRPFWSVAALAGLLLVILVGCEPSTRVPSGVQQIHVMATESEVRLDPARVRAGDVYLVLEEPTTSVVLNHRGRGAEDIPGPLTDDDLTRLARGDDVGGAIEGFDNTGCDAAQRAADRGQIKRPGHCGNVFLVTLRAGKYAILTEDPTPAMLAGGTPPPMAVLEVVP